MVYIVTFLEGVISFISPCMLPMIPLYLVYFAGDSNKKNNTFVNSISFVLGFTIVFSLMGAFASTIGVFIKQYMNFINIISGIIVILFGLNYLGVIRFNILNGNLNSKIKITGLFSAFIFGIIFAINLTPCVGVLLGSALMMASTSGTILKGVTLLFTYSIGLGIPIILSVFLISQLENVFNFIKNNYKVINYICGIFLIIIGLFIACGLFENKSIITNEKENEKSTLNTIESATNKVNDIYVFNIDNEKINLSQFLGKPTVINFWASWCAPCRSELDAFNSVYMENKDDVEFLMINVVYGEKIEEVKEFIKEKEYVFPVYFDSDGKACYKYSINSIPQTYFIDKNGNIVKTYYGPISESLLKTYINSIK